MLLISGVAEPEPNSSDGEFFDTQVSLIPPSPMEASQDNLAHYKALCRPLSGEPRLNRRAGIQLGRKCFLLRDFLYFLFEPG